MSYLDRLRQLERMKSPQAGTAQTAKTNLCSLCSPDPGEKKSATVGEADPGDYEERAAICEHEGGLPRPEAEQAAAKDCGFADPEALHSASVDAWLDELRSLARRTSDDLDLCRLFLRMVHACNEHGLQAARMGWDTVSLFGVDPKVASPFTQRRDRHGAFVLLATALAGSKIVAIDRNAMAFETDSGAEQRSPRFRGGREGEAVPVWEAYRSRIGPVET